MTDLSGWVVSAAPYIIRPGITFELEINRHNQNRASFMALFLARKPEKCNRQSVFTANSYGFDTTETSAIRGIVCHTRAALSSTVRLVKKAEFEFDDCSQKLFFSRLVLL